MSAGFHVVARSHIGVVRSGNEDAGLASNRLLAVADGMGGHAAGEVASAAVIQTLQKSLSDLPNDPAGIEGWLVSHVNDSHNFLGDLIVEDPDRRGMGTTLSVVVAYDSGVVIGHIGDSRVYRLRNRQIQQVTVDHTYVQSLVDSGEITHEQAAHHPRRNLVMRAIDGIHDVAMDVQVSEALPGDRFLVCSDGLTGVLSDEVLAEVLSNADLTYGVATLIDFALAAGAPDNVTVVAAEYQSESAEIEPFLIGSAMPEDVADDSPGQSRKISRFFLISIVALVLAVVGSMGFWINSQWYVAELNGDVAIFQGIPQQIGPWELSHVYSATTLSTESLTQIDHMSVVNGISAPNLAAANVIVSELHSRSSDCANSVAGCSTAL